MRTIVACGLAVLGVVLVAAKARSAEQNAPAGVLAHYLDALQRQNFAQAYALLTTNDRRYFRSVENYASVFGADRFRLDAYTIRRTSTANRRAQALVRERFRVFDLAHDREANVNGFVAYRLAEEAGMWHVDDADHPWKAHAVDARAQDGDVRITVKKVGYFERRMQLAVTFANLGDRAVTFLPYDRSTLRDERGRDYPIIAVKDWRLTDRTLFLGLRLPAQGQYTGTLTFELASPVQARMFTLTIAPALREGGEQPFAVEVVGIAA